MIIEEFVHENVFFHHRAASWHRIESPVKPDHDGYVVYTMRIKLFRVEFGFLAMEKPYIVHRSGSDEGWV